MALIHSEGILAGEMKHGPLALVDEHLPIVVVATRDSMYSKMESVIQQLLARNASLMIVCTEGDENMKQYKQGHDCKLIEVRGGEGWGRQREGHSVGVWVFEVWDKMGGRDKEQTH